jgi:crossover junction endodeoxyribonuclease RuvC
MVVIGIDPGTARTGFGLVRETEGGLAAVAYGVIETAAGAPAFQRLQTIYRELRGLLAEHRPVSGAVEKLFFARNVTTALAVGQARGVALLALADSGVSIAEYTPLEVKQAVAGYGRADKPQMQAMVRTLLGLDDIPRPDDAADALAVGICHLHSAKMKALLDERY